MASNRMIRDWTDSETIENLSPEAEVFFTRLIMKVDDYGNYVTNAKLINANLFPLKDYSTNQIELWMKELYLNGIIGYYTSEGKRYLHIIDFGQKMRRPKREYPAPTNALIETHPQRARTSDGQVTDTLGQHADIVQTSVAKKLPELEREVEEEREVEGETETRPTLSDKITAKIFEENWKTAFDERWITEGAKMKFPKIDVDQELKDFRFKCDSAPNEYHCRDRDGLRLGFIKQLKFAKPKQNHPNGTNKKQQHTDSLIIEHAKRWGSVAIEGA